MTQEEIKTVEDKLGVRLPKHYAIFLLNFKGFKSTELDLGNFLYATAESIIDMNDLIRFHGEEKIVKNKLIVGDNGGGDFYLIDLKNTEDQRVYIFDHEESIQKQLSDWEQYDNLQDFVNHLKKMFGLE